MSFCYRLHASQSGKPSATVARLQVARAVRPLSSRAVTGNVLPPHPIHGREHDCGCRNRTITTPHQLLMCDALARLLTGSGSSSSGAGWATCVAGCEVGILSERRREEESGTVAHTVLFHVIISPFHSCPHLAYSQLLSLSVASGGEITQSVWDTGDRFSVKSPPLHRSSLVVALSSRARGS